jgi:signal peptidase II
VNARATIVRAAVVAVAVVAADQAVKAIVRGALAPGERRHLLPGVEIVHSSNSGVAFSLFSGGGPLVVVVAALALAALLAFFLTHLGRRLVWLPTGLLVGGAAGNLVDRLRDGAVTDFVKLPHWPAFNLADVCITFGVLSLAWVVERAR